MKFICYFFILFSNLSLFSQEVSLQGHIVDNSNNPMSFVNVLVFEMEGEKPITGTSTDSEGNFLLTGLSNKTYNIVFSFIGFEEKSQPITLPTNKNLGTITLFESSETLNETVITAKRPTIQREPGKLVFNVENSSLATGNTFDLLKKTPGIIIVGDVIKIKFQTPIIYINNKRVYLSAAEVNSLLQNTDASIIKSIEVITNPSSKYDAEAGTVLNIITSKSISIGYKGSVNARYEQAIYPKYSFGTSQFYKNDWLNFYGSYNYSPRKEFKEDDNFVRFFEPDGSTNSLWNTNFTRTTESQAHQANVVTDFTLSPKQTLSLSSSILVSPNLIYNNTGYAQIANAQQQLDSTFTTLSRVDTDKHNLAFNSNYTYRLNDEGGQFTASANYVNYENKRSQDVGTRYFLPNGGFLRSNSFTTEAKQQSNIFTGQADVTSGLWDGTFETGIKYSNIDTESKLDFFNTNSSTSVFNATLSDDFNYKEEIFAEYLNFSKVFGNVQLDLGVRGEYTIVNGLSRRLGLVNTQKYFEAFPNVSAIYTLNENNNIGISYARSIQRPRFESLNPFLYFLNENNFDSGNPNLVPAIENRIALSYTYKALSFELYYDHIKNHLQELIFQDNVDRTIRNSDANLISNFQYSLDIAYSPTSFPDWWYFYLGTSTFYMENEFFAVESNQETYTKNIFGFFAQMVSSFTLAKDRTFTADVTSVYYSSLIYGSSEYHNQFALNLSFYKSIWKKRASITVGVNDIFDTFNIPLTSKYLNQDNSYFARQESRLFIVGLKYNFGNARLRDNNRSTTTDEAERNQ